MENIHIVTDSSARFVNVQLLQQYPITVVPNKITIAGKVYREGVDLSAEDALRLIAAQPTPPVVTPPTVKEYVDVYTRLARDFGSIVSIHVSRELLPSWQNARTAAQQITGSCEVSVIDSQSICAAQAMLVRVATKAASSEQTLDQVVRKVRGAVERLYSIYYVETLDYLLHNKILSPSHSVLGSFLGIKPFLSVEEGRLVPIEKVRTRSNAVEQLVEFLIEFTDIEDIAILQHKSHLSESTRLLQDRLALEYPGRYFPYAAYGPSLAALIGTDATGVVVLEKELDGFEDSF